MGALGLVYEVYEVSRGSWWNFFGDGNTGSAKSNSHAVGTVGNFTVDFLIAFIV